jgi:hypothetical protein
VFEAASDFQREAHSFQAAFNPFLDQLLARWHLMHVPKVLVCLHTWTRAVTCPVLFARAEGGSSRLLQRTTVRARTLAEIFIGQDHGPWPLSDDYFPCFEITLGKIATAPSRAHLD